MSLACSLFRVNFPEHKQSRVFRQAAVTIWKVSLLKCVFLRVWTLTDWIQRNSRFSLWVCVKCWCWSETVSVPQHMLQHFSRRPRCCCCLLFLISGSSRGAEQHGCRKSAKWGWARTSAVSPGSVWLFGKSISNINNLIIVREKLLHSQRWQAPALWCWTDFFVFLYGRKKNFDFNSTLSSFLSENICVWSLVKLVTALTKNSKINLNSLSVMSDIVTGNTPSEDFILFPKIWWFF